MQNEVVSYEVKMHGYALHASYFGPRDRSALLLHGGGNTASADILPLRVDLAERGIGTLALDHRGHGLTGGDPQESSLALRVEEAEAAIGAVRPRNLLGAVSMSMGGYVAVRLSQIVSLNALVMIAPAMYDGQAYSAPFGPAFSAIIRRHESWRDSDAFAILRGFAGRVLIVAGQEDRTIPAGVIEACVEAMPPGRSALISLPGVDHFVMSRLREGPADCLAGMLDRMAATLLGDDQGIASATFASET
ncbi:MULTISPECIES: alpha/beta hydrolase [Xanthobacteraceae]|uniref:alpha/beta hydrolase n=1 Tax=Xanthobacteraceae TaxID=335928 RepID=UPI002ACA1F19|nr:alpha/beta fold hydrolase [Labrys sp. ZIDIC5]MDZ5451459.1 alpha/beta fold hydrolase [Labrys sp. ZIDIC5]HML29726.1 alpha/beta fold hydrolase [Hyphomicrobium sp.]